MRFSMMAVDGNSMFETCRNFIVADLECLVKIHRMGCSNECAKEALRIFSNHASNLYVCGLIDEEFFRYILDGVIEDDDIEGFIASVKDIRKDIVRQEDGQKI